MQIHLSETSLKIEGQDNLICGGEFQYFRIPAQLWESSLSQLAATGIHFISCYIPWIWHESQENLFDFDGWSAPERNLRRLISLIKDLGLALIIRPGPYVYGEYQGFGIPEWLRQNYPEILMIHDHQTGKEMALNHPVYCQWVDHWLDTVSAFVRPWIDSGLIIACQIDNETGLPQFGGTAFANDMNRHTIELWQGFLQSRYSQIRHLNHVWKTDYAHFQAILPPGKAQGNLLKQRHWAEFIEDYLVQHLAWLKTRFEVYFRDQFFFMNDPCLCQWPNQSPKKSVLAPIGFDIYSKFTTDKSSLHDIPFSLSFAPEFFASINQVHHDKRPLMGVEVGSGWFDPRVEVKPQATLQKSMLSLLRGTRVLDYYLLHDCVEQDGVPWIFQSPLNKDGQATERIEVLRQIGGFCRDHGHLLASSEPLYHSIGLLKYLPQSWDYLRSNYSLWTAMDLFDSALTHFSGLTGMYGGLIEAGFNPMVHDLETIPLELLCKLKVVFFASTPVMHRDMYQKLHYYVEQGGTLISFGLPVQYDLFEQPYEQNPLFPAKAAGQPHRQQFGNNTLVSSIAFDMMDYQMMRNSHPHKLSLHTLDMMHPFVELAKHVGRSGTWLETDKGQKLWTSRYVSYWQGGGITPILFDQNQGTVAYSRSLGRGKIIFLGSLPGLFFDTPAYYQIENEKKQSVLLWLRQLLSERGLRPLVTPIPHTEVILRQLEKNQQKQLLLALINRGPQSEFEISLNYPFMYQQIQCLFAQGEDKLEKGRFLHLKGQLGAQNIYVALLS